MDGNLVSSAMPYIVAIAPLLLILSGVSIADLTIGLLIKLIKQGNPFKLKW